MNYQDQYRQKLTDADKAVEQIASGSNIVLGIAIAQPPGLMQALAKRVERGAIEDLSLYYYHSQENLRHTLLRYELMDRIKLFCMFLSSAERELIKKGDEDGGRKVVYYIPNSFSQSVRLFQDRIPLDTCLITVSPMDDNGNFTFGTNNDYTSSVARQAKRLIVEVNKNMPKVYGQSFLHVSEVDAIIENDVPLAELALKPLTEIEVQIGNHIKELVPEHACLQMGVGGLPGAVCSLLSDRKGLGIHTELLTPGLVNLIRSGAVDNSHKKINQSKTVFTFAMGDKDFYDFINDNPDIESYPADYVNDPAVIAQNDNVVSVNSTIEMDLTGACNSEYLHGHQYSASGGQLDFVRGAYASKGGVSIIACPSSSSDGKASKIVPHLSGPVTTPRTDIHYVVTEHGFVNLKGLPSTQRALELIRLAHPSFQDSLRSQAKVMHLI